MKAGWQTKTLGNLCDVLDSQRKPITKSHRVAGKYPYYGATGILDYVEGYLFDEKLVLVGEDGAKWASGENTAFAVEGKCWVNNHAHVLRPHRDQVLDSWLIYFLVHSDLMEFVSGLTVPKLNQGSLREIPIPVPPLPEQQRIVGILDEAFDGIATATANAEQNLQNARALFESHLQSVFTQRGEGWETKTLGDIAEVKGGKRVPKGYKLLSEPTAYPYLRVADFTDDGSIDMSDLRYVSAEVHRQIKNYIIYSTDLYLSIAGTIGKTGIIPKELDGANLTENACRLVFKQGFSNRFVYYFTQTASFVDQAGLHTRTAAQPKLALSRLSTIKLGIPSLSEQERLANEFDALREETQHLESLYQRKLAALDELKKSLLHQAFSGVL
ncbi:MAG TPA: restriction endonuclease subunit S [Gallionella sp.]|nr:restriction endonuclease subunit S [Gallionella sp.]